MAGKNLLAKQADFRSFYTCLTASRCKGFERILIKGLAPIFDIIRSNSLSVLDFLFVQQSLYIAEMSFFSIVSALSPSFKCKFLSEIVTSRFSSKIINVNMIPTIIPISAATIETHMLLNDAINKNSFSIG